MIQNHLAVAADSFHTNEGGTIPSVFSWNDYDRAILDVSFERGYVVLHKARLEVIGWVAT